MKKALLTGNGFSSHLMDKYKDSCLSACMSRDPEMQNIKSHYCDLFSEFSKFSQKIDIVKKLESFGFSSPDKVYDRYFDEYNLRAYIGKSKNYGIETLIKIGKLFLIVKKTSSEEIDAIKRFGCNYYWNGGKNGKDGIDNPNINLELLEKHTKEYSYIFTTNYDTILDDLFQGSRVCHLHGGFTLDRYGTISTKNAPNGFIVWGIDEFEKEAQLIKNQNLHKWNNGAFYNSGLKYNQKSQPFLDFCSLSTLDFTELYVLGYSGENDKHINSKIAQNHHLKTIMFYCSPDRINCVEYKRKIENMFENRFNVHLISYLEFWKQFENGDF